MRRLPAKTSGKAMRESSPRGIAVVDVGYTNTKIALFSPQGELLAERKAASRHVPGPPYLHIDPEPMVDLCRSALAELDALLPIDAIVPTAHGAAMACLDENGDLALPVMDYTSEPPPEIVAEYRKIMPSFAEALCPLLPLAITHGLQLYWQMRMWPEDFARVRTLLPWIQYVGYRLSGVPVTEISSMACQTHLLDIRARQPSRMARDLGWDRLFPRMAKAWEEIGTLKPEFRGEGFRGAGRVLGGVHDSTANFMRYVCAGLDRFTLVSTGTWSISFDPSTSVDVLDPERDTNTNTDVLGRDVCCSRFFGGKEFEAVAGGAPAEAAALDGVAALVARGTLAVPSFTMTSGPVPGSLGKGFVKGPPPSGDNGESLARGTLLRADGVRAARCHHLEGRHHRRWALLAEQGAAGGAGGTPPAAEGEGIRLARRDDGGCGGAGADRGRQASGNRAEPHRGEAGGDPGSRRLSIRVEEDGLCDTLIQSSLAPEAGSRPAPG
jgi:hypothetical protein